jgi:hypothetical protein
VARSTLALVSAPDGVDPSSPRSGPDVASAPGAARSAPVERVGDTDTLRWEGESLVVLSPTPMPEWRVGKYRKLAIRFRDRRYALTVAEPAHGGYRYVLDPWPLIVNEHESQEIVYDDAYVQEREANVVLFRKRQRQWWALRPVLPFLGFLPRRTKELLHERFGVEIITSTQRSVIIELVALGILSTLMFVGAATGLDWMTMTVGGGGGASGVRDVLLVAALSLDTVLRASILFDERYEPFGFFEWIVHPELKEHARTIRAALKARRERRARDEDQSERRK